MASHVTDGGNVMGLGKHEGYIPTSIQAALLKYITFILLHMYRACFVVRLPISNVTGNQPWHTKENPLTVRTFFFRGEQVPTWESHVPQVCMLTKAYGCTAIGVDLKSGWVGSRDVSDLIYRFQSLGWILCVQWGHPWWLPHPQCITDHIVSLRPSTGRPSQSGFACHMPCTSGPMLGTSVAYHLIQLHHVGDYCSLYMHSAGDLFQPQSFHVCR